MQDLEKLVDAAVDLRVATLKATEQGIIGYTPSSNYITIPNTEEYFQLFNDKDFKEILKTRDYKIEKLEDATYKYRYIVKVAGLNFMCITSYLLNIGDESKVIV